jgi:hypothetical protein
LLERAGEHLNPILIKEARQALKSRQFTATFALVLIAAWIWSFLGIAMIGPEVYYSAQGSVLLLGYVVILLFALVIIVPYTAYRSLAAELEDRTYELLSITALRARQVIGGKLATSFLQILVFLSAISPCIAFTYLLRGVEILTIVLIMAYCTLASLGLSLCGLLLATCSIERYRQVVASVLLVLALAGLFCMGCAMATELVRGIPGIRLRDLWIAHGAMLTAYLSYFVLLYLAAAAQLSFPSSNRSTPMRIVMLVQQALFCAWMTYAWIEAERISTVFTAMLILSVVHWYAMGMFLVGEPTQLSPRVQRDLPQSYLGRVFLTWFNPGAGTGYLFALSCFLAVAVLAQIGAYYSLLRPGLAWPSSSEKVFDVAVVTLSYLTIFLGLGKMLLSLGRRVPTEGAGVVLRVLVGVLLVGAGAVIPLVIQMSSDTFRNTSYSLLQVTNPFWTIEVVGRPYGTPPPEIALLRIILPAAALLTLVANLPSVVAEVRQVRIARPRRVAQEDAALAALKHPVEPVHTSPWD